MKISIWGNELCAWVNAGMLAQQGNQVLLAQDSIPAAGFSEPELDELLHAQSDQGRLKMTNDTDIFDSEIHFFCFPANQKSQALAAAKKLMEQCSKPIVLINQGNFGVGATREIQEILGQRHVAAYISDNLPEGKAIDHLRNLSSLTLGCDSTAATQTIRALMRPFLVDPQKVVVMSPQEAEFAKFAVTGMLALRIGYINELANLADQLGVDIEPIRHAMTMDSRISPEYLKPGCGFGGMNFPQYIAGLAEILQEERQSTLLNSVLENNEAQKETPFRKLWRYYKGELSGRVISIWGLSFKPNTTSIDNAPSLKVIDALLSQGAHVRAQDPAAAKNIAERYSDQPNLMICEDSYQALENSDALILLTEWREYSSPNFTTMKNLMNSPVIIDGRNLFDKQQAIDAGFYYEGIGR